MVTEPVQAKVQMDIAVTSQIVKKVSGKCRYFFDIRNNDKKAFIGSVSIQLVNVGGIDVGGAESFKTNQPIENKMGTSVNMDLNTCPVEIHGSSGINTFRYKVFVNNEIVKSGTGNITSKYEDIASYGL